MNDTAVIIIDAQINMFDPQNAVYQSDLIMANLQTLIQRARAKDLLLIYIQNNGNEYDPDAPDKPGWPIVPELAPEEGEIVIQKWSPNSFLNTTLEQELSKRGVKNVVLAGMQTEYCVDTTCRQAYALGYNVTLVGDAHSSYDSAILSAEQIIAHHNRVLNAFASIVHTQEITFA